MLYRATWARVVSLFGGLLCIYAGFAVFTARVAVMPSWYAQEASASLPRCSSYMSRVYVHCLDPKQSFNYDFQEFTAPRLGVPGHENEPIQTRGWWVPIAENKVMRGTVVLVHGGGADRRALLKHVPYLRDEGYQVLLIDCHNHGLAGRDGRGLSFGLWESWSVVAAAEWARDHVPGASELPIFAMGTSQGAVASLLAAAESKLIAGVVAENPYLSLQRLLREFPSLRWEPKLVKEGALALVKLWLGSGSSDLDARAYASRLSGRPVLVIHGDHDAIVPMHQSEELFDILQAEAPVPGAKGLRELWIVPGGDHEYLWNVAPRDYAAHVLRFLDAITLKQP